MKKRQISCRVLAVLIFALLLCQAVYAESYTADLMRLIHYEGTVEILDADGEPGLLMENIRLNSGETLSTGEDGSACVSLDAERIVSLDKNTRVTLDRESGSMKMVLEEGALLLDVQDKLDDNESLDIQTSTMTVGIRGTIVFVSQDISDSDTGSACSLGVLEGTAQVTYMNESGTRQSMPVEAGQIAVLKSASIEGAASEAVVEPLSPDRIPAYVNELAGYDPVTQQRVGNALANIGSAGSVAQGTGDDWNWEGTVTLVAQSASKLYDGQPLTRPGDVLTYGLPADYHIRARAEGSQTDAGTGANVIASYAIYDNAGTDVTGHFKDIRTVSGALVVDPAPLTVWTGSASKTYDGTPLTDPRAGISGYPGEERDVTPWHNLAYTQTTGADREVLYGVCGVTWVYGTNPLTGESCEIQLLVGEKLTVVLHEQEDIQSIEFVKEQVPVEELPEEILRIYARNPKLASQTCADTGWEESALAERIKQLSEEEDEPVNRYDLQLTADETDHVMLNSTNVRINVDTDITNYNNRPLDSSEAHFVPVVIPEDITVTATGSQTEVGESINTYTISWGDSNPSNYVLSEELGTLRVTAALTEHTETVTLTASSASKVYDGTPLTDKTVTVSGLPAGYTVSASAKGSRTNAGSSRNKVVSYKITDAGGSDVTSSFRNIVKKDGTLTVDPARATVKTGSAKKVYDGTALTSDEASITGLAASDTASVTASGSQKNAGSSLNTYRINWGSTDQNNYTLKEELGTLEVTKRKVTFNLGGYTSEYDGDIQVPEGPGSDDVDVVTDTFEVITDEEERQTGTAAEFSLPGGKVRMVCSGFEDAGTYTIAPEVEFISGRAENYEFTYINSTMTIMPMPVTVHLHDGSDVVYDGGTHSGRFSAFYGEVDIGYQIGMECGFVWGSGKIIADVSTVGPDAGDYTLSCSFIYEDAKPENYQITVTDTALKIVPAEATVKTGTDSKPYDGTPLTCDEAEITGLISPETVTVTATGSQTEVGSSTNTYEIDWGTTNRNNYTVTEKLGTLTVTSVTSGLGMGKSIRPAGLNAAADKETSDSEAGDGAGDNAAAAKETADVAAETIKATSAAEDPVGSIAGGEAVEKKQESEKETLTKPSKEPVKETDKGSSGESAKQTADPEPAAGTDKASVSDPDVSSQRIPAEGAGSGE